MSPWFHAKLWFVRAGIDAHAAGVAHGEGVAPPVAKKNQSGSAKSVKVGVRKGSAVTMCSVFSSTGSAIARMIPFGWFSTVPVYGFTLSTKALASYDAGDATYSTTVCQLRTLAALRDHL